MRYSDFKRGWAVRPVLGSGFTKPSIHTHPWWSCRSVPFPAAHLWGKSALLTYSSHSVSTGAYLWQKKTTKNKKKKKQKKKTEKKKNVKMSLNFHWLLFLYWSSCMFPASHRAIELSPCCCSLSFCHVPQIYQLWSLLSWIILFLFFFF